MIREKPIKVSFDDARKVFNLDKRFHPLNYTENQYKIIDGTVLDYKTSLMWQKSGSDLIGVGKILSYIKITNESKFMGYCDWRLPTIEELITLWEKDKQLNNLYISTLFDQKQFRCWSSDDNYGYIWSMHYDINKIISDNRIKLYVRLVRKFELPNSSHTFSQISGRKNLSRF